MTDGPLSPRNKRVTAARRLLKRAFRSEARAFLVEGPQAVREALGLAAERPGLVRQLFVTGDAQGRHPELLALARGLGVDVDLVGAEVLAELAQTVTPQGVVAVCAFVDVTLAEVLSAAASDGVSLRGWSRCWPRSGTRATPEPSYALPTLRGLTPWCSPRRPSTPTTASACGRAPGRCSTCPSSSGRQSLRRSARCGPLGCAWWPPTGRGTATSTTAGRCRRPRACPRPGCSATRPGDCRRSSAPSATPWCACPSTAGPRVAQPRHGRRRLPLRQRPRPALNRRKVTFSPLHAWFLHLDSRRVSTVCSVIPRRCR